MTILDNPGNQQTNIDLDLSPPAYMAVGGIYHLEIEVVGEVMEVTIDGQSRGTWQVKRSGAPSEVEMAVWASSADGAATSAIVCGCPETCPDTSFCDKADVSLRNVQRQVRSCVDVLKHVLIRPSVIKLM